MKKSTKLAPYSNQIEHISRADLNMKNMVITSKTQEGIETIMYTDLRTTM